MSELKVPISEIHKAKELLKNYLEETPLLHNKWLSEELGCEVYLKLENMHPIGSFKIRGATYRISKLNEAEKKKGVITASAGNHAQGVAWGCKQFGVKPTIVMPKTAPLMKVHNTAAIGAQIVLEGDNYDEAFSHAQSLAAQSGMIFVPAYKDAAVIAGQGTVALEILDQLPEVDVVIGSMGGGGLMSGVGIAFKALKPETQIIGTQATGSRALVESIRSGSIVKTDYNETFADGIKVKQASPEMLGVLKEVIDQTFHEDEDAIAAAVLHLIEKAKIVAEGAAALPLAALEQHRDKFKGKKVVLIISGGNIDVNVLSRIIDAGLIRAGRRLKVNVFISDKPGSLAKLTQLLAKLGANILQTIHDRNSQEIGISDTAVELVLETRGPEFSKQIVEELKKNFKHVEIIR